MPLYLLLCAACVCQIAGLALLRLAGRFSPVAITSKKTEVFASSAGFVLYGAGCLAMIGFALAERHFLLLAGQIVCTALCFLGMRRRKIV